MVAARSEVGEMPGCVCCVGVGEPIVRVLVLVGGREAFGCLGPLPCLDKAGHESETRPAKKGEIP